MVNELENPYIKATYNWLEKVVVGLNFCPFAHKPFLENSIRIIVDESNSLESLIEKFNQEVELLSQNSKIATTLIIYPNQFNDFENYLDWASVCENELEVNGFEGEFQAATFHPNYLFEGTTNSDPENYTNRSPYPLIHIIREDDIEWAREKHPDIEGVPKTNIEKAKNMGLNAMKALFERCFNS